MHARADKSTYSLGEEVKITVSLENWGFITHSFKSRFIDPVIVSIEYQYTENPSLLYQVWYSPFHENITEFWIKPFQSLERRFLWNQTMSINIQFREEIEPGSYYIKALIPSADSSMPIGVDNLFLALIEISIVG